MFGNKEKQRKQAFVDTYVLHKMATQNIRNVGKIVAEAELVYAEYMKQKMESGE